MAFFLLSWTSLYQSVLILLCFVPEAQVEHMATKHHFYILPSGRANLSAMVPSRIDEIAEAMYETITSLSKQEEKVTVTQMW